MQNKILVMDNSRTNRKLLQDILSEEYELIIAEDGQEAIDLLQQLQEKIIVVLLGLQTSALDEYRVLEEMNRQGWIKKIPVLVISNEQSPDLEKQCFDFGVSDFIIRPIEPYLIKKRVENIIALFMHRKDLEDQLGKQEEALKKQYRLLQMQAAKLKQYNTKFIDIIGTIVEYRSLESAGHIAHIKAFTKILATYAMREYPEYGLDEAQVRMIVDACPLHDIGKIALSDSILLKPAKLTKDEREYLKSHTLRGCEILESLQDTWGKDFSKVSYDICRHHHEKYDGSGYPDGLKGEEIPISAQIVSLADTYEELISAQVYKDAYPKDKAFQMIVTGEIGIYSPKLIECFRKARRDLEKTADRYMAV